MTSSVVMLARAATGGCREDLRRLPRRCGKTRSWLLQPEPGLDPLRPHACPCEERSGAPRRPGFPASAAGGGPVCPGIRVGRSTAACRRATLYPRCCPRGWRCAADRCEEPAGCRLVRVFRRYRLARFSLVAGIAVGHARGCPEGGGAVVRRWDEWGFAESIRIPRASNPVRGANPSPRPTVTGDPT